MTATILPEWWRQKRTTLTDALRCFLGLVVLFFDILIISSTLVKTIGGKKQMNNQ